MAIKIIFFDVGSVLLHKKRQPLDIIAEHFGLDPDITKLAYKESSAAKELYQLWDAMRDYAGQERYAQEAAKAFLAHVSLPASEESVEFIANAWNHQQYDVAEDLHETLDYLRPKYRLGIISNAMPSRRNHELTEHDLIKHFDPIVISKELGVGKPDAEIYHVALELAGVKGEEAVFIDDWPKALEGARAVGIKDVYLLDPDRKWDDDQLPRIDRLSDLKKYL